MNNELGKDSLKTSDPIGQSQFVSTRCDTCMCELTWSSIRACGSTIVGDAEGGDDIGVALWVTGVGGSSFHDGFDGVGHDGCEICVLAAWACHARKSPQIAPLDSVHLA